MKGLKTAATLLLLAGVAAAQPAPSLVTSSLLHSLPPDEVVRRVTAQIGDLLQAPPARGFNASYQQSVREGLALILSRRGDRVAPAEITAAPNLARIASVLSLYRTDVPNPSNLLEIQLRTWTQSGLLPGMCLHDDIPVQFLPVGAESGPQAPVKAVWLYVMHKYQFHTPPAAAAADPAAFAERDKADEDCAMLEGAKSFMAEDDASALRGYWLANALRSALESADPPFPMDCEGARTPAECRRALLNMLDEWYQILGCAPGGACSFFTMGSELRIVAGDGPRPVITTVELKNVLVIQSSANQLETLHRCPYRRTKQNVLDLFRSFGLGFAACQEREKCWVM
jgi:hypothetical protein